MAEYGYKAFLEVGSLDKQDEYNSYINKSFGDTSVDIVTRALGAGATKYFGRQMKDYLKYDGSSFCIRV